MAFSDTFFPLLHTMMVDECTSQAEMQLVDEEAAQQLNDVLEAESDASNALQVRSEKLPLPPSRPSFLLPTPC